jgi:glutaredoxin
MVNPYRIMQDLSINHPKKPFIVYTKSNCIFCDKLKFLGDQENENIKYINCDVVLQKMRSIFMNIMKKQTKQERITFPIVFHDGEYIGGYKEYEKLVSVRHLELVDFN